MTSNTSLLYGFDIDRQYFIEFSMQFQIYATIFAQVFCHPPMLYLLIFQNKSMKRDIRVCYVLTQFALISNGWSFCLAFRIYPLIPMAALYCEGPLCRAGLDKQILTTILAIPVVLSSATFPLLMARMQQAFVPIGSKNKFSLRTQILLLVVLNTLLVMNVIGFGYFGQDCDDSERLLQEPELAWVTARGGTVFMFGPPGEPQYFKWGQS
ncbi:hypothetical protein PMAYCL1PPCAC_26194 [Pristionchus mayeri]|uniref:G protein-coupled receptor n=1 Tax=Pristionchus mayeri TaxID=1317129 RepID=A0AAN5D407_9BILA|nr:hypothetical protein PMAYCL1PPCAC_26194 [Pristionchus mayeri]